MKEAADIEAVKEMVRKIGDNLEFERLHSTLRPESLEFLRANGISLPRRGFPDAEELEKRNQDDVARLVAELRSKSILAKEEGVYSLSPESINFLMQHHSLDISASGQHIAVRQTPEEELLANALGKLEASHRTRMPVVLTKEESAAVRQQLEAWRRLEVKS